MPVRLSAIVPATNRPPTLPQCLAAIRAAEQPPDEILAIEEPSEAGPACARNLGAERARGDVLAFIDADVLVHRDAFVRIRQAFADDPSLAAVFGSYDDRPQARGVVSAFRNLLHHHVHQSSPGRATTFWAGLGAVRREAFLGVHGFDEQRYPRPSIEDVEFGMRLTDTGAVIQLDPALLGTHLKEWRLFDMVRTDLVLRGIPWVELLLDRGSSSRALNLGWRNRLSVLAVLATAAGALARRPKVASVGVATLLALNASFYRLLIRRRGPAEAVAGLGLHALHHLTSAAALGMGVVRALVRRRR